MAEIYSHSRLSSFEDCPRKFQYRYVLKIPSDSESIEGFVGKRVHDVLERLYKVVDSAGVPSLDKVLARYQQLWSEHYDGERIRIVRTENPVDFYRSQGERCLTNYYRRFYPFDTDETLGLEKHVHFALDDGGSYRIQGIIDRLVRARDGAIEIHDYKTSQRMPRQIYLDRDRQLALYQMAIGGRYGSQRPVRLVWHYLAPNRTATSTRTPEQLELLRTKTMEVIDQIRAETEFEPRTGPLCRWCEYNDICPAFETTAPASAPALRKPAPTPPGQLDLL